MPSVRNKALCMAQHCEMAVFLSHCWGSQDDTHIKGSASRGPCVPVQRSAHERLGRRDARRLAGRAAGLDEAGPAAVAAGVCDAAAARRRLHRRLALLWQCGLPIPVGCLHPDPEGVRLHPLPAPRPPPPPPPLPSRHVGGGAWCGLACVLAVLLQLPPWAHALHAPAGACSAHVAPMA